MVLWLACDCLPSSLSGFDSQQTQDFYFDLNQYFLLNYVFLFHFDLNPRKYFYLRPNKIICMVPDTSLKKIGSVGRIFILFYFCIFPTLYRPIVPWCTMYILMIIVDSSPEHYEKNPGSFRVGRFFNYYFFLFWEKSLRVGAKN